VPREYPAQCWSCLGEFDAAAAVWCTCNARTPTKLCPFCFHCFCQADLEYQETFWRDAPDELKEERRILHDAPGTVGEALIRSNLLNTDQLVSALKWQINRGGTIEQALVDLNLVSRENLRVVARGQAQGGAAIDLSRQLIDASLVTAISVELCHRKKVLPISREEIGETPVLTLAMAGPTDVETIDQIQTLTGCRIIPMSTSEKEILERLADLFPDEVAACRAAEAAGPGVALSRGPARASPAPPRTGRSAATPRKPAARPAPSRPRHRRGAETDGTAALTPSTLEEIGLEEAPADRGDEVRVTPAAAGAPEEGSGPLQTILAEAIARKASHVQVEVRGPAISLFLRIDGTLYRAKLPAQEPPRVLARAIAARAGLPADGSAATGRLTVKSGGREIEVVARRLPFAGGESLLLKIIDPADFVRRPEDLGLSAHDRERLDRVLGQAAGLVLVSGPPHNGVEATRSSLMAHLAGAGRRVLAIESPRWLDIGGARQEELAPPPDPARVRQVLASAPGAEVLFLPDLQAQGLAALAVERAAECLVVATIQARRASQVPAAILWHGIEPGSLAPVLRLVVSQRLVRRLCDGCRAPAQAADKVLKMMGLTPDEALDLRIHQGTGCEACGPLHPGYAGRVALFEVLEGTPEITALVESGGSPGEIEREARRGGMSPLRAACLALVGQGITSLEEFQKGNF
jgi:type II secretory ATPase GspE/PulE/Tfp pilus assembly ATPase PilB-like protein